ncbi:imidazole glycerol phosphate synthase subunit HisH [Corynebacterium lubricantis]|uniref:imidazole glycerol phosphate synthase subunit HisH n=1 Tax=Corynebacterium lubricantis TaxID=541095 RepID=UPI000365E458|nr:imidazole glycerol phosphate synthase subunit HisH [Corynebacterium lubricantis]
MSLNVAVLDYGSGNLRSVQRALEHVGVNVEVTADPKLATEADGLVVPGVGAYAACMKGLNEINGARIIGQRLAGSRPVLGICVGLQILFEKGVEHGVETNGTGEWPGVVDKLDATILPHMGWNTVDVAEGSELFAGLSPDDRYYFVHTYGVQKWEMEDQDFLEHPKVSWTNHENARFVAAVENGPLCATQFHPEKSGDVGLHLLKNWINTLS